MLQQVSKESVDKILKNCGFKNSREIERMTGGWVNSTFKIETEDDQKYALRVYTKDYMNRSTEALSFEVDLLSELKKNNLPVPTVCKPKNSSESDSPLSKKGIFTVEDNYYCVLFEFIFGGKCVNSAPLKIKRQEWQALKIAEYLGAQHKLTHERVQWKNKSRCAIEYIEIKDHMMNDHEEWAQDHVEIFSRIGNICKKLQFINDEKLRTEFTQRLATVPQGVIHADLHDENVLFNHVTNEISAVLDFDDAFYGPLVADVAQSIFCWCFVGSEFDLNMARNFVNQYQKSRGFPFTEDEWRVLVPLYYITGVMQLNYMTELLDEDEIWMIIDTTECLETMMRLGDEKFIQFVKS